MDARLQRRVQRYGWDRAVEHYEEHWLRRLAIVTDAWHPQTNGVVNTLSRLAKHLEAQGIEVLVIAPDAHRTVPLPSYSEIRVAWDPWKATRRLRDFAPDAVHVATEGPLGFWINRWLRARGLHPGARGVGLQARAMVPWPGRAHARGDDVTAA